MKIQNCTLTGADDNTKVESLIKLHQTFPIAEIALLYGDTEGTNRYPTEKWISNFNARYMGLKAIHLCGGKVDSFMAGEPGLLNLVAPFSRIQLNFNLKKNPEILEKLVTVLDRLQPKQLCLVQVNSANAELIPVINRHQAFQCLFDESDSAELSSKGRPKPLPGKHCGYAGGLGFEGLALQLDEICQVLESSGGSRRIWIDMESSLRDLDDRFSIEKCQNILVEVTRYNRQHA